MLHTVPGADDFDRTRQLGEIHALISSRRGKA
jgi:p-hydroxybenzoate 3-monooxygenase